MFLTPQSAAAEVSTVQTTSVMQQSDTFRQQSSVFPSNC